MNIFYVILFGICTTQMIQAVEKDRRAEKRTTDQYHKVRRQARKLSGPAQPTRKQIEKFSQSCETLKYRAEYTENKGVALFADKMLATVWHHNNR